MELLAIHPAPGDTDLQRADALAERAGLSRYEARTRLRALGDWPGVLAGYRDPAAAQQVAQRLREDGLRAWTMEPEPKVAAMLVRRFGLAPAGLWVECDDEPRRIIDARAVGLALAATRFSSIVEHVVERNDPEPGLSLALRTLAGIGPRSGTTRATERRREEREPLVQAYPLDGPPLAFCAGRLQYAALPDLPVSPTRATNWKRVQALLRSGLPSVRFDDRLLARNAQSRMLGSSLPPARHLDAALQLLAHVLGGRASDPYR